MELSYWEVKNWLSNIDLVVIGSGIVGLNCALAFRQKNPKAKIVVLERGILPQGASTKNAGFACFGSVSELLADLQTMTEEQVFILTKKRIQGLEILKQNVGEKTLNYQQFGGYEYFFNHQEELFAKCSDKLNLVNKLLKPLFPEPAYRLVTNKFQFQEVLEHGFYTPFEGQIETGKMMQALLKKVHTQGILLLNNTKVLNFEELSDKVNIETDHFTISSQYLAVATNGFSKKLLDVDLQPARAQVLITEPIKNLQLKGNFHFDEGYYYFRNIDNRILLGGARNKDIDGETTTTFGQTKTVQSELERMLHTVILPQQTIAVEHRWSGIMAMGDTKQPIVKKVKDRIACGVRLGGMGIAIGSTVGADLAHVLQD